MIELEIGRAIVAVEREYGCFGCIFEDKKIDCVFYKIKCLKEERKDHKNVIFKMVDYPPKPNSHYIDGTMRHGSKTTEEVKK